MPVIPHKHPMPSQDPAVRAHNFNEVATGYTAEIAVEEAKRCLNCKNKPCMTGCPVQVKIPEFIALVAEGKFLEAAAKIKETSALPAGAKISASRASSSGRIISAARASSAPNPAAAPNPAPARAIQLKNTRLFFNIGNSLTFC